MFVSLKKRQSLGQHCSSVLALPCPSPPSRPFTSCLYCSPSLIRAFNRLQTAPGNCRAGVPPAANLCLPCAHPPSLGSGPQRSRCHGHMYNSACSHPQLSSPKDRSNQVGLHHAEVPARSGRSTAPQSPIDLRVYPEGNAELLHRYQPQERCRKPGSWLLFWGRRCCLLG